MVQAVDLGRAVLLTLRLEHRPLGTLAYRILPSSASLMLLLVFNVAATMTATLGKRGKLGEH